MSDILRHTPKPLVEEHYHITELINAQEKRHADREYHRNRIKASEELDKDIQEAKPTIITDFYCERCSKDFRAQAVKQVDSWDKCAYYKTKCFNGHWCMRLITDKHRDRFWSKSKLVALDRGKAFADTIQPHETNFNLLYGKK